MPYNGPLTHYTFYATVHIGPDSPFASKLPEFNLYLLFSLPLLFPLLLVSPSPLPLFPFSRIYLSISLNDRRYLTSICELMTQGSPVHQIGVHPSFSSSLFLSSSNLLFIFEVINIFANRRQYDPWRTSTR